MSAIKRQQEYDPALRSALLSKRANIFYLEHCAVVLNGQRVEYLTSAERKRLYYNIPIANTTCVLLGNGTSITQAAMRALGDAEVPVAFTAGGGTPLSAAANGPLDLTFLLPQNPYRATEYLQQWAAFWFDDGARLRVAKAFQKRRLDNTRHGWVRNGLRDLGFKPDEEKLDGLLSASAADIDAAPDVTHLLAAEGRTTKALYQLAARAVKWPGEWQRAGRGEGSDLANRLLDHGNYLAYGLAGVATWVLGIPHGFAVMHGKTRRGGLVFDVADLVKDGVVLPLAFAFAAHGAEKAFRERCVTDLLDANSMDEMIDALKHAPVDAAA